MQNIALIVNKLQGGGAERCAADLSLIFSQNGFQVFLFTDLSIEIEYEYKGILIDYSSVLSAADKTQENGMYCKIRELRELKNKYKIDIAISFMQAENYFNILSRGQEKVILTTHSVNSEYAKCDKSVLWEEETFRDLYQYADLITFPSEYCRKDWIEHYGDKNHITRTIYNPVHMMSVREKENKENTVIAVGRMHGIKRQWHIIRAFKMVKEKCPDSKLIILGDGRLRSKLEKLILELGLENDVEMPGNVANVQDYLKIAKIFTMTSRLEALPCSALEAFSAGVPVVACDCPGGIREEFNISCSQKNLTRPVQGEGGILVPYINEYYTEQLTKEEKILADEIVYLLQHEKVRCEMGKKARQRAERFSPECIGNVWLKEISELPLKSAESMDGFEEEVQKRSHEWKKKKAVNVKMYISYYQLLEKWMVLRERGISVKKYFEERNIRDIIIYGMGKMTYHLLADLKGSNVHVVCIIDKSALNIESDFFVITDKAEIPKADCIIITPVYDMDIIKPKLERKTSVRIISLSEVVGNLYI